LLPFVRSVAAAVSAEPRLAPLPVALIEELPVLPEFRSVELDALACAQNRSGSNRRVGCAVRLVGQLSCQNKTVDAA
jgi:hypothetical protein